MNIEDIIKVPYTTQPRMHKNTGDVFNHTPDPNYIKQKKHQLGLFYDDLYGETYESVTNQLVRRASSYIGKPTTGNIIELALQLDEDIAIMYNGVLSSVCFCFPSGWVPRDAVGKTLQEIHRPVADGQILREKSTKIAETMANPDQGSFKRTVWTITKNPNLSNHPLINDMFTGEEPNLNSLYFRYEKQTTLPMQDFKTSLFFVKVEVVPLISIWNQHKKLILQSIDSMSDAILQYKNLCDIKQYLTLA